MTIKTGNTHAQPGKQVHFLKAQAVALGTDTFSDSVVAERGRTITLTREILLAAQDRNGDSYLDLLGHEDAQLERWGEVRFRPGPWPEGEPTWIRGDALWEFEMQKAQQAASALTDEDDRAAALREVRKTFGTKSTSRTIQTVAAGF